MNIEEAKQRLREHRKHHFAVKVNKEPGRYAEFEDEKEVLITHNGHQWQGISLTKDEAQKVVDAMIEAYGLERG